MPPRGPCRRLVDLSRPPEGRAGAGDDFVAGRRVRGTNWSAHVLDGTLADMRRTAALIVAALGGRVDVLS
jgi:hypothetical protein